MAKAKKRTFVAIEPDGFGKFAISLSDTGDEEADGGAALELLAEHLGDNSDNIDFDLYALEETLVKGVSELRRLS